MRKTKTKRALLMTVFSLAVANGAKSSEVRFEQLWLPAPTHDIGYKLDKLYPLQYDFSGAFEGFEVDQRLKYARHFSVYKSDVDQYFGTNDGQGKDNLNHYKKPNITMQIQTDVSLFKGYRVRFGKIKSAARFKSMMSKSKAEFCGANCAEIAQSFSANEDSMMVKLSKMTKHVNALVQYRSDSRNYGKLDHWSSPKETLMRGSGDCEDIAIVKMGIAHEMGVPFEAMEIVVVRDERRRQYHAVLSISMGGKNYILDNLRNDLVSDGENQHYVPIFSVSKSVNYIFGFKGATSGRVASISNLKSISPS